MTITCHPGAPAGAGGARAASPQPPLAPRPGRRSFIGREPLPTQAVPDGNNDDRLSHTQGSGQPTPGGAPSNAGDPRRTPPGLWRAGSACPGAFVVVVGGLLRAPRQRRAQQAPPFLLLLSPPAKPNNAGAIGNNDSHTREPSHDPN